MVFASCSITLFTFFGIFSSIYHVFVYCDCVQPPIAVNAISLYPGTPLTLNETQLLNTDLVERRALCKRLHISERLRDKYAIFLPQDEDFYVAPAHGYMFGDEDSENNVELALRCPTVPVMYVSAELNERDNSMNYTIRIQKPRFDCYNFTFENVKEVSEGIEDNVYEQRMLEESILFGTRVEDRWKMCRDARDLLTRYKVDWKSSPRALFFREPKVSRFWHSLRFDESEIRCAFHCPTVPDIYLSERAGMRNRLQSCSEILISVVGTADDSP